ncbi:MAG: DNA gyrase inhibitor YacG [Thiobacillaceae bacterium]|jgi:endogenous inhibitor of DNA gyrase (YacG/DUF329 family)|nr:DNA gyrase inhibitor YacG [Thiobacillaceae bacterium]MBP9915372.1 DNA gyrase inhibitor YacG [Thiobacillaceae bacterium]
MTEKVKVVACPTCGKDVEWRPENPWRPFCGERCKMIDLGEWATEKYKVPVVEQDTFDNLEPRG